MLSAWVQVGMHVDDANRYTNPEEQAECAGVRMEWDCNWGRSETGQNKRGV